MMQWWADYLDAIVEGLRRGRAAKSTPKRAAATARTPVRRSKRANA